MNDKAKEQGGDQAATDQARSDDAEWAQLEAEAAADAERAAAAPPAVGQAEEQAREYPKDPQVEQAIQQLLSIGFGAFAPNWQVTQQEINGAADAYARSLEDIFPGGAAALGPHFASVLISLAIFGPRLAMGTPPKLEERPQPQPEPEAGKGADDGEG